VKREEVDPNGNEHADVKGDPKPNAGRHGGRFSRHEARGNGKLHG
jgi:hypothetical protein